MSRGASPFTGRRYGVVRVTREWEMARSSFYHQRENAAHPGRVLGRRGPKTAWSDAVLLEKIREVIAASPFHGEGHRKGVGAAALRGSAHVEGASATTDARGAVTRAVAHGPEARESTHGLDHHCAAQ